MTDQRGLSTPTGWDIKITRQNATYDRLENFLTWLVRVNGYTYSLGSATPNHKTDPKPNYNPNP